MQHQAAYTDTRRHTHTQTPEHSPRDNDNSFEAAGETGVVAGGRAGAALRL